MKQELAVVLKNMAASGRDLSLNMGIEEFNDELSADMTAALESLLERLRHEPTGTEATHASPRADGLPSVILFPFARHSSYRELCHLTQTFQPKDVWPCTVDQWWIRNRASVGSLFGRYCSEAIFEFDQQRAALFSQEQGVSFRQQQIPDFDTQTSVGHETISLVSSHETANAEKGLNEPVSEKAAGCEAGLPAPKQLSPNAFPARLSISTTNLLSESELPTSGNQDGLDSPAQWGDCSVSVSQTLSHNEPDDPSQALASHLEADSQTTNVSESSTISPGHSLLRREAYSVMVRNSSNGDTWEPISLLSTDGNHQSADVEL
ncbi:hypothetical protein UVI_02045280 [Ustilaginoidea virens]|nr:hypothetical protein UVI_02045280 [Ustilaginoidea virens]